MTDTEAKALALVNAVRGCEKWEIVKKYDLVPAEALFAALDRHAAELRELKERFSEVAGRAVKHMARTCFAKGSPCQLEREAVVEGLTDFIIPAPDPLVEEEDPIDALVDLLAPVLTHSQGMAARERENRFRNALTALCKIGEAGE